ncbi:MAG: hypothetical protein WC054_11600, partial [Candidatus Nanopelagicales bacterium]
MADARVIPIKPKDPKDRPKKKAPAKRPAAKRAPAAGSARGSRGSGGAATAAAHEEEPEVAREHAPLPGAEPAPVAWDRKVADLLAFMRRRVTGDYEVDE